MAAPKYDAAKARKRHKGRIEARRDRGPRFRDKNGAEVRAGDRVLVSYPIEADSLQGLECVVEEVGANRIDVRELATHHLRSVRPGWCVYDWDHVG